MSYVEARHYTSATDMKARYASIRRALFDRPKPVRVAHVENHVEPALVIDPVSEYKVIVVKEEPDLYVVPAFKGSAKELIYMIMHEMGAKPEDIFGPSHKREFVEVRHAINKAVYLKFPALSLPQIGALMNRDHTSILASLRRTGAYGKRGQVAS